MWTPLTPSRILLILPWVLVGTAGAQTGHESAASAPATAPVPIRADLHAERTLVQTGQPVWVHFGLTNLTSEPVTLKVPETPAMEDTSPAMGLPLSHVFSAQRYTALTIKNNHGEGWDRTISFPPHEPVPVVRLAPYGSVGIRLELTHYYRSLRQPGKYTLTWRPYFAAVESAPLTLEVIAERQALILTEFGSMTIRFYYDDAPNAVQNFVELVEKRFYDRLTFHRIVPTDYILGGDPRGDGKGGRTDGKRIKAEFSKIPFEPGTVGMAHLPSDPDSASSQFFITTQRKPSYDGTQTAFGYLVGEESFETLRLIAAVPTDSHNRPRTPVAIRAITLDNVPGREPALYGSDTPGQVQSATTRPAIINEGMLNSPVVFPLEKPGAATRPARGAGS